MEGISRSAKVGTFSPREENRYFNLIQKIGDFLRDVKADEIYNAMKDSEYSKEYAVQRLKEMFEESMNSEKEIFIGQLESEIAEERELNKVLQEKNIDLDQDLSNEKEQVKVLSQEYERAKDEIFKLQEINKKHNSSIKNLQEKLRTTSEKEENLDFTRSQQISNELSFSKSQTLKLQKELDSLQRDKTVAAIKENEYKRDHQDLIMHIKKLQSEKECLQVEIEQLSHTNFELKGQLDHHLSNTQLILDQKLRLEESLRLEVENNREEIEDLLLKFKEKSSKFKSKILEQKKKIDENKFVKDNLNKTLENKINELEAQVKERNLKVNELEVLLEKAEISNSLKLENGKKMFEQQMGQKLNEMQMEVQVQVKRCQDYERQIKAMTETKLKSLEIKNAELEHTKQELRSQLTSALQSLEQLRAAYTDQLSQSEELRNENIEIKQILNGLQSELKENQLQIASLENLLDSERQKFSQIYEINNKLEANIHLTKENEWKTRQELDQARRLTRNLENNLESTLKDSRNSHRESMKVSELTDQVIKLEAYCGNLEKQVKTLKSAKTKTVNKGLRHKFVGLKHSFRELKSLFVSQLLALENYSHNMLEKISYKVIEKAAENRKLKSQYSAVCKENTSLSQSVSVCSQEMDALSQAIAEKQKAFKDGYRMVKIKLKGKFENKLMSLEKELQEIKREKNKVQSEAGEKIRIMQEEILYFQNREREVSEVLRKGSAHKNEINILEDRICELESFLEAERLQKEQVASLKNKELEELKSRMKRLGISNC